MRRILALMATVVLLAACSGEGSDETTTTAVDGTTSTSHSDTTTTSPSETTTTTPPETTTSTSADPLSPEGSGCAPESATLPDGEWYGGIRGFDDQGITFDLACLFTGEAAVEASAEDGEESPPPNDYYVRNENEEVRVLAVNPDTPITWYPSGDPNDEVQGTYAEWVEYLSTRESYLGIWVTMEGGRVTEIAEWWVP